MAPFLVNHPSGQQEGPLEWKELKQGVQSRRIPGHAVVTDVPTGQQRQVFDIPDLAPLAGPRDSGASSMIPSDNPPALLAYYLGVFSLASCLPVLGIIGIGLGIAAVVYGRKGLRLIREDPTKHGTAHAWIGIVAGSLFGLLGVAIHLVMLIAIVSNSLRG